MGRRGRNTHAQEPADPTVLEARRQWFDRYVDDLESKGTVRGPDDGPYACPCCRFVTLAERGGYVICPVCFWEDDGQDDPHADEVWGGPNGRLSLTEARSNFAKLGASSPQAVEFVRPPDPKEIPDDSER